MNVATLVVAAVYLVFLGYPTGSLGHHSHHKCKDTCKDKKELPSRNCGEDDSTYYKCIFSVDCTSECGLKKFYERVFDKYKDENEDAYVKRVDFVFVNIYPKLDCRFKSERQEYLSRYYKYKYAKNKNENDEQYFERVLPRKSESECKYNSRVEMMRKFVEHVDWSKVKVDLTIGRGFSLIRKIASPKCDISFSNKGKKRNKEENKMAKEDCRKHKSSCHHKKRKEDDKDKKDTNQDKCTEQKKVPNECENVEKSKVNDGENLIKWVETNYCRKDNEDIESYYKRICDKTVGTNEEYVKILTITRSLFKTLDLWYNQKYLRYSKPFYLLSYSKKSTETQEEYFKRLVTRETYESQENWAKRINLLCNLFPSLPLWYDSQWYESCSKKYFQEFYKKLETEANDIYLKRVFTRVSGESEECFWKRMKLIKTTFPNYKCWYDKENLQKLDACKGFSEATSEKDLKDRVEAAKESEECKQAKLECLQTFFKSSKSSQSSQSSQSSNEEQEIRITSNTCQ